MTQRLRVNSGRVARMVVTGAALFGAVGVVALVAVKVPGWERRADELPEAKDRIAAQNEIVRTLIQLAGGAVVVTGLYFTSRQIGLAQQGQITDRFNKAIDHLGDDKTAVRLGGIYALARIAADSPRDASTVVEIFASFLRESTPALAATMPVDVRTTFGILGGAEWARGTVIDLRGCKFSGLQGERLDFSNALLDGAVFRECRLPETRFDGASLVGADFSESYLRQCGFRGCNCTVTEFTDASLRGADFAEANVFGARFGTASLLGATFDGATNAIRQQFSEAVTDEATRLPVFGGIARPVA